MASNFDFLKNIDRELFSIIQDGEKLFRDEYFNQCAVQLRIFAEKIAKKVLGQTSNNLTFDDTINCLKDKIKTEAEREFVEDLFFIKREGNKCAHGEETTATSALEAIKRCFEIAINYSYSKKKDEKIKKLQFDQTLLITQKPQKKTTLIDEYVRLATEQKEELLNLKQGDFNSQVEKTIDGRKDESRINQVKKYKTASKKKKELTPSQQKIKAKIKDARKNLRENINNVNKKIKKPAKAPSKKSSKKKNQQRNKLLKFLIFLVFVTISLFLLTKMIFFF